MELLALGKGLEAILTQPVVKGRHRGGGGGGRLETERERGKMRGMLGEPPWLLFFSDQGQRTLGPHHTPVTTHNSSRPRKWDETLVWPTFHHEWTETSYPWLCGLVGVWERQEEKCVFFLVCLYLWGHKDWNCEKAGPYCAKGYFQVQNILWSWDKN